MVQALEHRIHELEMDLEREQHHHAESVKALTRQERRLREVGSVCQESMAEHQQLQDLVEQLHHKLKAYKRQIDELVRGGGRRKGGRGKGGGGGGGRVGGVG